MGVSLPSRRVTRVLSELVALHGCPSALRTDNGPEFTAQPLVDWCAEHGVAMHDIQPGTPDQNASIERFNRSYRTEVLNAYLFESLTELRALTDAWLRSLQRRAGPMTASAGCRRSRFCRGLQRAGQSPFGTVRLTGKPYVAAFGTLPPKTPVSWTSVRKGRRSNAFAGEKVVPLTLDDSRLHAPYAAALRREVGHYLGECNPPAIRTLYFGGGTPSPTVDLVSPEVD